jgi:hypothetical protein
MSLDELIRKFRKLEWAIIGLPETERTLSDDKLASLGLYRGPPLNIDNPSGGDRRPVFFQPLDDSPQCRQAVQDYEEESQCPYEFCPREKEHRSGVTCAIQTLDWVEAVADNVYPDSQPEWEGAW